MHKNCKLARILAAWPRYPNGTYKPMAQRTLMELSGVSIASVSRNITKLHAARKVVITHFLRATAKRKHPIAMWRYYPHGVPADMTDAPWPEASTNVERCRAYRDRMRKSGAWEDTKARRRADYNKSKTTNNPMPSQHPLITALYGEAP